MDKNTLKVYNEWLALAPQRDKLKERISQKFMLEFNYNSNHIEGNTLTYGQTELLLLFGKVVGDANMRDLEEMKAHNVGLKMVITEALRKDIPLTETFIRQVHKVLLREDYEIYRQLPSGVVTSYIVHAGCYKTRPNSVITQTGERFEYASPEETPSLMNDLLSWYNNTVVSSEFDVIQLASMFHYRYIRIHPFEDGNGRIARLMVNFILARYGFPMIVVPSKNKEEYLSVLNKCDIATGLIPTDGARATLTQIAPFVDYLEKLVVIEMQNDITISKGGTNSKWWYNGEIITFKNDNVNKLIELILSDSYISIRDLSEKMKINKSAIQKHLKTLQEQGFIVRLGSTTRGEWHIALQRL